MTLARTRHRREARKRRRAERLAYEASPRKTSTAMISSIYKDVYEDTIKGNINHSPFVRDDFLFRYR